jgi:type IV secretion system protein VirB11
MKPGERTLRTLLRCFEVFLEHAATTEVVVNRPGEVGVEQAGQWSWHDMPELTLERLDAISILAASMTSREVDASQPLCASTLPGGERIQICRPPATMPGIISLTIRKPATKARTIDDPDFENLFLEANRGPTRRTQADEALLQLYRAQDWRGFFKAARTARKTIGACGATGSGKTDLLKRLLQLTSEHARVVTIEDNPEFGELGPRNRVNLFYGDSRANLAAEDTLKAALRMRPDEIWMQEVRGAEAFAYLRALAAGHPGGCTSWHAEEGQEWDALELMVKQHPAGLAIPEASLRQYLRQYIDIVVWCARGENGFRAPRVWFKAAVTELATA